MRSSVGFKSNLYPIGDPPFGHHFCAMLRDSKALEELQNQINKFGVPAYKLTPQQQRLRDSAIHCCECPKGDYPWGTETHNGPAICRCRQTKCKHYAICTQKESNNGN